MEVLVTCDESTNNNSINFWNPTNGTKLMTLRSPPINQGSLTFILNEGLVITESGKPFIHFWQSNLQTSRRILCPGKPGPMTMTPDGAYLIVAIEEKINIWQVSTGRIVTILNSHYRPVTVLKMTDDGSYLLSAGEDGIILAFQFLSLVSKVTTSPTYTWSDHSFPVTDLHIGIGTSTVFSVSSDRTAKIYSLQTGGLLLSVSFPSPLTSVVADSAEFAFYVGDTNGSIFQMKLHGIPRSIEHHVSLDSAAIFKSQDGITCLTISSDGKTLVSSDTAGDLHLWDISSRQLLKTIKNKVKITNLKFWLGDVENLKGRKETIIFPAVPKLVEAIESENEANECVMVWNRFEKEDEEEQSGEVKRSGSIENSMEIANLKMKLENAEKINRKLHQFCVENILDGK